MLADGDDKVGQSIGISFVLSHFLIVAFPFVCSPGVKDIKY